MASDEQGWVKAVPLHNYSSLHELSLTKRIGWGESLAKLSILIQLDANFHSEKIDLHPKAFLAIKTLDASKPLIPGCCFSVTNLMRWRVDIQQFSTFKEFLDSLIRWHKCNYKKSEKTFREYGGTITYVERDWSEYVDVVYKLYEKVAVLHGDKLYDISFYRELAKRPDYKLLCAWHNGEMIGTFILQDEGTILHSMCCGMDYNHSSKSYAYSWMHYELIRIAIESKKYTHVDVGLTANNSKREICFEPISSRMDVYAKGRVTRFMLKCLSKFVTATIDSEAQLKFQLRPLCSKKQK